MAFPDDDRPIDWAKVDAAYKQKFWVTPQEDAARYRRAPAFPPIGILLFAAVLGVGVVVGRLMGRW